MDARTDVASLLVAARFAAGLSQRQLAGRAGTSGATVAAYERGSKEPRLSTLRRLVEASGRRLLIEVAPSRAWPLTREDRRSLALHRAVLRRLLEDPDAVRTKGLSNVATMRRTSDGSAASYLDEWESLLQGAFEELVAALTSLDLRSRDLRQTTPFAGVVPPRERWDIVRASRRQGAAA